MRRTKVHPIPKFLLLLLVMVIAVLGAMRDRSDSTLVIWVTGRLQGDWLPQGDYEQPLSGGLSRLARALELYRRPGELLVDLGQFRYPPNVSGETRRWRLQADGFLQSLTRLNYTALNVSRLDLSPWPPDLASRASSYGLPLLSSNVVNRNHSEFLLFQEDRRIPTPAGMIRLLGLTGGSGEFEVWQMPIDSLHVSSDSARGWTILLTDLPVKQFTVLKPQLVVYDLVLWLNAGKPLVDRVGETWILGIGEEGSCLGRLELRVREGKIDITKTDLTGWKDGRPYRHHPARESLRRTLRFWEKKPDLSAYLWQIPETLSPQKQAETQRRQTNEALSRYSDLEELHSHTPTDYTNPNRCLDCHTLDHPRDLAKLHGKIREAVRDYPVYERCLPCHATGFDDPAGFLLPWERPDLLMVTCEGCHEGSYTHALEGKPPYPPRPEEGSCGGCHEQRNFPQDHPLNSR